MSGQQLDLRARLARLALPVVSRAQRVVLDGSCPSHPQLKMVASAAAYPFQPIYTGETPRLAADVRDAVLRLAGGTLSPDLFGIPTRGHHIPSITDHASAGAMISTGIQFSSAHRTVSVNVVSRPPTVVNR